MNSPEDADFMAMVIANLRPIEQHLRDPQVTEIMLNPDGKVWVERLEKSGKKMVRARVDILPDEAERMVRYIAALVRRELNETRPRLRCRLPGYGIRVQALMPPVVKAPAFAFRRPAANVFPLADYVAKGAVTSEQASELARAVADHQNILISGGTGSGKTTLANALLQEVADADERVLTVEDDEELQCPAANTLPIFVVEDVYTWRDAIKDALRLRPDRIIIGELRDGVALDFVKAMNTGHRGGIATIHADSALTSLDRLCALIEEVAANAPREIVAQTIDLCVHMQKDPTRPAGVALGEILRVRGYDFSTRRWIVETVGAALSHN